MAQHSADTVVAVTGASGFVGAAMVRELLEHGHTVRALVRDRAKAREAWPAGALDRVQVVVGDVMEKAGELVRGCGACIHLIGILREGGGQTFQREHIDATRAMVAACEGAGVRRYLHMSALGVSDTPVSEYQRTKWEAEGLVRGSELAWTIFRPGLIHGQGSAFLKMAKGWASGLEAPYMFMPYFTRGEEDTRVPLGGERSIDPEVAPIAVEDVARAFVTAIGRPQSVGEVYNLVGPETLSYPALLREIRDRVHGSNHRLEPWGIPAKVGVAMATVGKAAGLGAVMPFDAGMAKMASQDSTAELAKVRTHLGLEPRPFRETFRSYAESI